jgi:hypothetical protein
MLFVELQKRFCSVEIPLQKGGVLGFEVLVDGGVTRKRELLIERGGFVRNGIGQFGCLSRIGVGE